MTELMKIRDGATRLFTSGQISAEITPEKYRRFTYPRLIPMMDFEVKQYRVNGFGGFMTMLTDTVFGMQLLTCAFMPYDGAKVPFLLIDIMLMKNKRIVFTEYYDTTSEKAEQPLLKKVYDKYKSLEDYHEKPAWYIRERAEYSLIKSLDPAGDRHELSRLVADSVRAYKKSAAEADKDINELEGLIAFRERMIKEGNPSSATLKKVFGEKGAADFFKNCVMPLG